MKKLKVAIVPMSEVAKSPGMRLDPGYYLGKNEEQDFEKAVGYAERMFPSTLKRLWRTGKALLSARWRVFRWRVEGRIRYK